MATDTLTSSEQKDLSIEFLKAFWRADLDSAYKYLTPEARFLMMPSATDVREMDARFALNQIIETLFDRFHEDHKLNCEVTSIIAEGDEVAVEYIARAKTFRLEDYENFYSAHLTFSGPKIDVFRTYADTMYLNRLLSRKERK